MPEEEKKTTEVEPEKSTTETTVETDSQPKKDDEPEKVTTKDIMDPDKKEKETVGLDKFLEIKKENKELRQSIKDLQAKVSAGATKVEISEELQAIAEEFPDIDPKFLEMIGKAVEKKAASIAESVTKPITEGEKRKKQDEAFKKHFDSVIEDMPEFKDIVNPEVIKRLALDPDNADKTFPELIEEAYGSAVPGKRTIETTKAGGGKEPAPLDVARARKDPEYFAEVMANPKLKAQYNAEMLKRGI